MGWGTRKGLGSLGLLVDETIANLNGEQSDATWYLIFVDGTSIVLYAQQIKR